MIPYTHSQVAFASASATETKGLDMEFCRCPLKVVEIITTGFSGTLDIQGRVGATGSFDNVSYSQLGQDGAQAVANDQLSYTTSTARARYLVSEPWPYLQLVMSRSAGSITINAYGWAVALSPTAVIKLGANSGVDIGDVDVLTEPSGAGTYTTPAHTAPAIGTSSETALAANASRVYAMFINDSDTVVYMNQGGTAVANTGIRLNANGGSFEMSRKIGNLYTGAINAIHGGTGDKVLLVTEGT